VKEGRLELSTPIRKIIPEIYFDNPWRDEDPVRIVHLLEHTSGIDSDHFNEAYNLHDDPDIPLGEVLAINPDSRRVQWRPGSRMAYSNDGYTVLGHILERVTGHLNGRKYHGHGGGIPGFNSLYARIPELGLKVHLRLRGFRPLLVLVLLRYFLLFFRFLLLALGLVLLSTLVSHVVLLSLLWIIVSQ
jgi:hypothetical protein